MTQSFFQYQSQRGDQAAIVGVFQFFSSSVFGYFIQTILKGIGLKAILLIMSPKEHPQDMSILSRMGKHIPKSQTGHICDGDGHWTVLAINSTPQTIFFTKDTE